MEMAVIKTGGKQYVVQKGDSLYIEKLGDETKAGDKIVFDQVLMTDSGSAVSVGAPTVPGAKVAATVIAVTRAKKIDVVKYKAKSRYHKRRGHKQPQVKVQIDSLA